MEEGKPHWLTVKIPAAAAAMACRVDEVLVEHGLHTVCRSAKCPNLPTCWGAGTATFMILGDVCTRACRFCAVTHGRPAAPDPSEPTRLAQAIAKLELRYAVVTSVDRDDLLDGGSSCYAEGIRLIRAVVPGVLVEALIPDFGGDRTALEAVASAGPHVVGHNVETVRRLTPFVRDRRAGYDASLTVLRSLKTLGRGIATKSSLLLGLGETEVEIEQTLADLRGAGVDIVVLGQYLRPTPLQLPVARHVAPEEFHQWEVRARNLGFRAVVSAPLARTSLRAAEAYAALR